MEIKNTAIIITGGASGMGAATANLLASLGAKVAVFDMMPAQNACLTIHCDVTQADSLQEAFLTAEKQHGPARVCINCAGILHSRRIVNQEGPMPLDEFRHVIDTNLIGTFNTMRLAAQAMIPLPLSANGEERGVIINTASIAAFEGQIGQTAYSASKGAIVSLTLPAARELAQFGIRVMAIAPGLVDTPMFEKLTPEARSALAASVPFPKRLARPEEFAQLIKHIIENTQLNGEVIRLDGALRLPPK